MFTNKENLRNIRLRMEADLAEVDTLFKQGTIDSNESYARLHSAMELAQLDLSHAIAIHDTLK